MPPTFRLYVYMGRRLRHVPEGGGLFEVTTRTLHGRLLLRPSPELNEIAAGVLGRAQRLYGVEVKGYAFTSSHYHLIVRVVDAEQLQKFAGYFNGNLAKEVGRLTGWKGKIWDRRYQAILITDEEEAQVARLRYVLAHGVKEGLVCRVQDWPGLHCAHALLGGPPLTGYWFSRSQEYAARQRGEEHDRLCYAEPETVTLTPLPCWNDLSPEAYRRRVAALVEEIEQEAALRRKNTGGEPLGPDRVKGQHPYTQPRRLKKSPAPLLHFFRRELHDQLYEVYSLFVAAFRTAADKLKRGDPTFRFPVGSFPPALPFVRG